MNAMRPRDESAAALRDALGAVARERAAAVARHDAAQQNRRTALTDAKATPRVVVSFETQAREAAVELERLDLVRPELEQRLTRARERERASAIEADIEQARQACVDAADDLQAALSTYPDHARAIASICDVARAQQHAVARFCTAISRSIPIGTQANPEAWNPGVALVDSGFLDSVVLPGLPGEPMVIGKLPTRAPAPHYFANEPPKAYG